MLNFNPYLKQTNMKKKAIFQVLTILLFLASCNPSPTNQPTLNDYKIGEKWTWKWVSSVDGEVRGEGEDIREVVDYNGVLGLWNGFDTLQISQVLNKEKSSSPFRDWPLEVGKKWKYESEWTNESGEKGITSQDVEIISFEELQVVAGKFMAYKIKYDGFIENYKVGGKGKVTDVFWYCPGLKTNIKHVQQGGNGFLYTSELIGYTSAE